MATDLEKIFEKIEKEIKNANWDDIIKKNEIIDRIENRYCEIFKSWTSEERSKFIKKINNKYRSPEYTKRWFPRGIEPPEDLKWLILRYAEEYGKEISEDTYSLDFATEAWLVDDTWIIKRHDGQGSFITISTKEEDLEILERLKKFISE